MFNLKLKNFSVIVLTILFFASILPVDAGQPTCAAPPVQTYDQNRQEQNSGPNRQQIEEEQKQLAAAQTRFEKGQTPPSNGAGGANSETGSTLSFYLSVLIIFSGLYALVVLLYGKFNDQNRRNRRPLRKAFDYALKPSTAMTACGLLFASAIIGGTMTSPTATSAQNRRNDERRQTNLATDSTNEAKLLGNNAISLPVFSEVETIGGDGITQIGAPYFDSRGNRYVRGGFTKNLTLGNTNLTATRDFDGFIAKYNPQGVVQWVRQVSGAAAGAVPDRLAIEGITALAVDENYTGDGNVYVGGSFVKTITLETGTNPNPNATPTLNASTGDGINYESFLAKYDANGNLLWARGGNSGGEKSTNGLQNGQNGISKIAFDYVNNPYVAGFASGDKFLGLPIGDYNYGYVNQGKSDIVLAKLDGETGIPTWLYMNGGAGNDNALDMVIYRTGDYTSNLALVGSFDSPLIGFGTTNGLATYSNSNGSLSTFIAGFNLENRTNSWVNFLGNSSTVGISQIAAFNPSPGFVQIFATGYYKDQLRVPLGGAGQPFALNNTRTGTGEAGLSGYVTEVDPSDGTFVRAANLAGPGKAIAIQPFGDIYVAGTVWNTGKFTDSERLESLGGDDIYVASINRNNFSFKWAKTIAGADYEGLVAVNDTADADNLTRNVYNPLGIAFDPNRQDIVVSGDFQGILSLDCLKVRASGTRIHSYIAVVGGTSNCRLWTGRDTNFNNWQEPDNWNDGIVPSQGDSVYINIPTGLQNPVFTAAANVPLTDLTVVNRTLTLQKDLIVNNRFDLLAGVVNAGNNTVSLGGNVQSRSIYNGRVIGKVEKQFDAGAGTFIFPVGTANGYSPVTLSNIVGTGTFAVTAKQGAYPNTATNLPMNRANRWWNLTNGGLTQVDLTFKYLAGDITAGYESAYRAHRIPTGGGAATLVPSSINTTTKTVTVPNVSEFSDWTLAQIFVPTAAGISISGNVNLPINLGLTAATVTLTDAQGISITTRTNKLGGFRFSNVAAGQTYIIRVQARGYQFAPQAFAANEDVTGLNFAPLE